MHSAPAHPEKGDVELAARNAGSRQVALRVSPQRLEAGPNGRLRLAWFVVLAALLPAGAHGAPAPQPSTPSIRLSPETVQMDAFYTGATVRIAGETPSGTDVIVVVRGAEEAEFFNRKARVGPVWVNVDRVHVAGAPSLFIRLGGGDLESLLDPGSIDGYQLDVATIEKRMLCRSHCRCRAGRPPRTTSDMGAMCVGGVEPDTQTLQLIRKSFLALKAEEGAYKVSPRAVRVAETATGATFTAELDWPRRAPPGTYRVEALACRDPAPTAWAPCWLLRSPDSPWTL
jgi:hypothetical protein